MRRAHKTVKMAWLLAVLVLPAVVRAQTPVPAAAPALATDSAVPVHNSPNSPPPDASGESLDHIVAIVNQDVILESDVQEEIRFASFEPFSSQSAKDPREAALTRLINRALILQQEKQQPQDPISDADVQKQLNQLRGAIPACAEYKCDTQEGWDRFLAANDFTPELLTERWRQRMQVLRFIELRFRSGIRITPQEISDFYTNTMLPQYAKRNATAPPLASLSSRIEEILLQRKVTALLGDWLKSLRDQGSVRILQPGEDAP